MKHANERTEFYINRNRELQTHEIGSLLNKCDAQRREIEQKDLLNSELMVMIGQLKESTVDLREKLAKSQEKNAQLQEEAQMNKRALELANDHVLELQMENNMMMISSSNRTHHK